MSNKEHYQKNGLVPFWFLNDFLQSNELRRQVRLFKEAGCDGYILHGRSGLSTPYMAEGWFDAIECILLESEKCGMEVWFYDEEPYPSGAAAGSIVRDYPDARSRALTYKRIDVTGPNWIYEQIPWGRVLLARAVRVDDSEEVVDVKPFIGPVRSDWLLFYQKHHYHTMIVERPHMRATTENPHNMLLWKAPKGLWKVEVFVDTVSEDFKYWGSYTDLLDPFVAEEFIKRSYDPYIKRFKKYLGGIVKGFFIDEPVLSPHGHLPWSRNFAVCFQKINGYCLIPELPKLFDVVEGCESVRDAYWLTVVQMWEDSFWKPLFQRLSDNGLRLAGHLDSQIHPWKNARTNGGFHRWCRYFSPSGCDHLFTCDDRADPLLAQSIKISSTAARRKGYGGCVCEAFANTNWSVGLDDLRYQTEWLTVTGVGRIIPHAFFYSISGYRRHDAAPSHFYQNPFWPVYSKYSSYARALGSIVNSIPTHRPVALLFDEKQFWHVYGDKEKYDFARKIYSNLLRELVGQQVDFDIIDEEVFLEASVEKDLIVTSFQEFKLVIAPIFAKISDKLRGKIDQYLNQEGRIILVGLEVNPSIGKESAATARWVNKRFVHLNSDMNYHNSGLVLRKGDSEPDSLLFSSFLRGTMEASCLLAEKLEGSLNIKRSKKQMGLFVDMSNGTSVTLLKNLLTNILWDSGCRYLKVVDEKGNEDESVAIRHFRDDSNEFFMLVNRSEKCAWARIQWNPVCFQKLPQFYKVYCGTLGQRMMYQSITSDGQTFAMAPKAATWVMLQASDQVMKVFATKDREDTVCVDLPAKWDFASEPLNRCELSEWEVYIRRDGLEPVWKWIGHLFSPMDPTIFKRDILSRIPRIVEDVENCTLEFTTTFEVSGEVRDMRLLWEESPVAAQCSVWVNGQQVNAAADMPAFSDCNTKAVSIRSAIQEGTNTISIIVSYDEIQVFTLMANPLRLVGTFSLEDGVFLGPTSGTFELVPNRPLKFSQYVGIMELTQKIDLPESALGRDIMLSLPGETPEYITGCELFVDGQSLGKMPWPPYKWELKAPKQKEFTIQLNLYWKYPEPHIPESIVKGQKISLASSSFWWE